jgi:hypothetical protein
MGSLTKMLDSITGATEEATEQKERLEVILKLAKSKLQVFKDRVEMNFSNPGAIEKLQIPGIRAMRYIEQYHVACKEGLDQKVQDHMTAAIDAFFSIGDGHDKKAVQDGVKSLISTALAGFIGSTEVGESEQQIFVVIPENNAFIRADICCWKYHFEQHKLIEKNDTAMAYLLCKSVVDHNKVTIDELIYLATEAMSKREVKTFRLEDLSNEEKESLKPILKKYYYIKDDKSVEPASAQKTDHPNLLDDNDIKAINKINKAHPDFDLLKRFEWIKDERDNTKGWWKLDFDIIPIVDGAHFLTTIPDINKVEAYIDELIRVWKKLKDDRG